MQRYDKYDNHIAYHWNLYDSSLPQNQYAVLVRASLKPFMGKTGMILDIGSGDGRVDRILVDLGFKVTGIEPEEEGNKIAREKVPEMGIIPFNLEDAVIPEVDYLYSLNTIEHCKYPQRFVDAMKKVKNFGVVVTDNKKEAPDPYHTKEFTLLELVALFKDFKTEPIDLPTGFIGLIIYAEHINP